ncbi:thioredoxin domain-containing protein 17 [Neodiprion pinetum]|uniref:thioredoxin domain-containing protein 17-like n=1 Tax=Neodiprion fabricii TaxID=2872261 RepID=UPI001ED9301F|nr:thioredoxin domain-containing protein 17-like [Neodiprion fabricii]XP_046415172.1 thioredoxin domain-containing protein 17-like [Neodiprion fabricii]XP_046415173.1 thioredoxin domain-containing protein 17-like [Neodiprion fabricii]XP_046475310.1 thioredoxin domain-containing protein 17-like [Neodiprion pinetum]XP_046475311.1 thioredoxin domain-containing protein 17-like [Neodiprion pinetum]XP_046612874.1 thioredoxin domain-containing protein 17-like [Neodiprion virginianus]
MVVRHHIEGYENFQKFTETFPKDEVAYILFSGSKLPNGSSWCPDCVEAEPFIQKGLQVAPAESHFIYVEVGDRSFWKDLKCPFRTDNKTNLKVLPTLARWGTQKRLEGDQCLDVGLVEMLITDEDD